MIDAIYKAHDVNQTLIEFINKIVAEVGKPKHSYTSCAVPQELFDAMKEIVPPEEMEQAVFTDVKQVREENIRQITARLEEAFADKEEWLAVLGEAVYQYQKKTVRKMILKDHKRPDGRAITQIRPLAAEVDIIPRVHGSAMFTRGQTQICNICTLAPLSEVQKLDGLDENEVSKRYMHHYNFPSYSVGETKPSRGPGRREIGHGALAEQALMPGTSFGRGIPLCNPYRIRDLRIQRFYLPGFCLRIYTVSDGSGRSDQEAGCWYFLWSGYRRYR